jgi:dolichol kinase
MKEFKRQTFHLGFGLTYAAGYFFELITVPVSLLALLGAVAFSFYLKKQRGFFDRLVLLLDREHHFWDVPLRGAIFYLLGVTITISFFDILPALAGILVLAIADSVGTLYGKYLGRVKIPWNKKKHLEGPIIGGGLAAAACFVFLPVWPAVIGGYAGALIDTLDLQIGKIEIDDNLLIPVVVAGIISLL